MRGQRGSLRIDELIAEVGEMVTADVRRLFGDVPDFKFRRVQDLPAGGPRPKSPELKSYGLFLHPTRGVVSIGSTETLRTLRAAGAAVEEWTGADRLADYRVIAVRRYRVRPTLEQSLQKKARKYRSEVLAHGIKGGRKWPVFDEKNGVVRLRYLSEKPDHVVPLLGVTIHEDGSEEPLFDHDLIPDGYEHVRIENVGWRLRFVTVHDTKW